MTFVYTNNVPNPVNDPSVDVPKMQVNTATIDSWTQVDHIGFNDANGGKHKKTTYNVKSTPAAPTDPESIAFTANGLASSVADLKYINQNGTFPLSTLRAVGSFTTILPPPGPPTPVTLDNGFNVLSITAPSAIGSTTYTITLTPNATSGSKVIVFVYSMQGVLSFVTTFAANVLTIQTLPVSTGQNVSFAVFQV